MAKTRTGSFPIGFRCNCAWQDDLDASIAFALEHGFEAIDVGTKQPDEIKRITAAGLRLGSVDIQGPWGGLAAADPSHRRDTAQAKAAYIRALVPHGAINFFACVFPENDARPRSESFAYAVDGYGQLCHAIAPLGAKIVLEGYPGSRPHFPTLACTPADCRALFKEVGSDALGVNFDPSHLLRMGIDPVRFLEEFAPRVFHAHAKDTELFSDALYEHGNLQSATLEKPHVFGGHHWRYTIPGHGCAPWATLLAILKRHGYQGALSIELEDENFNGSEQTEKQGFVASRDFLMSC